MNRLKAILDFSNYTGVDLAPVAGAIHEQMLENAATFPNPPVTMAALGVLVETYKSTLAAKASNATADVLAFQVAREELESALGQLGSSVNGLAKGDPVIVTASGFPSYSTLRTPDTAPPAAPADLRLRQGALSGSLVARYRPSRPRSMNEVQINLGDPMDEAGWKPVGLFSGGTATISDLTPGTVVWVRVRTAGLKGVMGAWSDPAKLMVI